MSGNWTPGPWRVEVKPEVAFVVGPDNARIAMLAFGNFGISEKTKATMDLIAAAPDLYAALEALIAIDEDEAADGATLQARVDAAWDAAKASLAKARGQA